MLPPDCPAAERQCRWAESSLPRFPRSQDNEDYADHDRHGDEDTDIGCKTDSQNNRYKPNTCVRDYFPQVVTQSWFVFNSCRFYVSHGGVPSIQLPALNKYTLQSASFAAVAKATFLQYQFGVTAAHARRINRDRVVYSGRYCPTIPMPRTPFATRALSAMETGTGPIKRRQAGSWIVHLANIGPVPFFAVADASDRSRAEMSRGNSPDSRGDSPNRRSLSRRATKGYRSRPDACVDSGAHRTVPEEGSRLRQDLERTGGKA